MQSTTIYARIGSRKSLVACRVRTSCSATVTSTVNRPTSRRTAAPLSDDTAPTDSSNEETTLQLPVFPYLKHHHPASSRRRLFHTRFQNKDKPTDWNSSWNVKVQLPCYRSRIFKNNCKCRCGLYISQIYENSFFCYWTASSFIFKLWFFHYYLIWIEYSKFFFSFPPVSIFAIYQFYPPPSSSPPLPPLFEPSNYDRRWCFVLETILGGMLGRFRTWQLVFLSHSSLYIWNDKIAFGWKIPWRFFRDNEQKTSLACVSSLIRLTVYKM